MNSHDSQRTLAMQTIDLLIHAGGCAPFLLTSSPEVGRQLVASRRIRAGEILCQEEPLVVGPNQVLCRLMHFEVRHIGGQNFWNAITV